MKRELGVGKCGLACCICSQNNTCAGCDSEGCSGVNWCDNRKCSIEKGISGCYECDEACDKGMFKNNKPLAFMKYIREYGVENLLDALERNENNGVIYHREGITGDYDDYQSVEEIMEFIINGVK